MNTYSTSLVRRTFFLSIFVIALSAGILFGAPVFANADEDYGWGVGYEDDYGWGVGYPEDYGWGVGYEDDYGWGVGYEDGLGCGYDCDYGCDWDCGYDYDDYDDEV